MAIQSKSKEKLIVMKNKVSSEYLADITIAANMPNTKGTIPVYDESGSVLGYIALYTNANLS